MRLPVLAAIALLFGAAISQAKATPTIWKGYCADAGDRKGTNKPAWCTNGHGGCIPCPKDIIEVQHRRKQRPDWVPQYRKRNKKRWTLARRRKLCRLTGRCP